jgi:DNA-binding transcriptional LysR family regulator
MPDIKTLEIYRDIADLGSFQAAARNMGLSLSAISLQMKRLEEFAQLNLFDRSKKPPRLTRDGLIYLDKIDAVLKQWQELEPADMLHPSQKHLTIGTVHSVLSSFLPLALKSFVRTCRIWILWCGWMRALSWKPNCRPERLMLPLLANPAKAWQTLSIII